MPTTDTIIQFFADQKAIGSAAKEFSAADIAEAVHLSTNTINQHLLYLAVGRKLVRRMTRERHYNCYLYQLPDGNDG
jgi:response regulator of citrate/malate metabolism